MSLLSSSAEKRLQAKLDRIEKEQAKIMPAIDDLKSAVANLGTSISNELSAISAKLSSPSGTSDADVEAVVQQIDDLKDKVDQETATLSGNASSQSSQEPSQPTS